MELLYIILIIISILLIIIFIMPTIYDYFVFGNVDSIPLRGGRSKINPLSIYTILGIFAFIFVVLYVIRILF